MDTPSGSRASLTALAKKHLGLTARAPTSKIPASYLEELKKFIASNPNDTNFRLTLEPGKSFGSIACLEPGCDGAIIKLIRGAKAGDGGKKEGFGSLAAYKFHITNHHGKQQRPREKPRVTNRRVTLPATSTARRASVKTERSELFIKPEPVEPSLPLKRDPDAALSPRLTVKTESAPLQSSEKVKTEVMDAKRPLATVDSNSLNDIQEVANMAVAPNPLKRAGENLSAPVKPRPSPGDLLSRQSYRSDFEVGIKHEPKWEAVPLPPSSSPAPSSPIAGPSWKLDSDDSKYPITDTDDAMDLDVDHTKIVDAVVQKYSDVMPQLPPMRDTRDENGDFHGRGRDTFQGPQAAATDIDKFLMAAGNSEQFDGNARVDTALETLGLTGQYQLIPGMQIALMPHQIIGVAWMINKENSYFKGGILGDEMGLGKTVQMIATMIKNVSTNPACRANLVIAPTALLEQWKNEIEAKTNTDFKVLIYHGNNKPRRKKELLNYDVVLTTFATMAYEWPDVEAEQKRKKAKAKRRKTEGFIVDDSDEDESDRPTRRRGARRESGILFQMDWYRVILDEAQFIRNKTTRASRAVSELQATYRWCLTGTPIVNGLADVYAYLRFIKLRPWYDWSEFHAHISRFEKKNPATAVVRLQAILASCMIRRTKSSQLDGKRLIELPPKEVELVKLEFTEEEREIYKMVEARTQATFNRYLRAGTVLKNYSQVLVLLLRLRQICAHPILIQEDGDGFVHPDEVDDDKPEVRTELTRARYLVSMQFVDGLKAKFKEAALKRIAAEKESVDAIVEDEECPICFDHFTNAVITPCSHTFCKECITDVINSPLADGDEAQFNQDRPCPVCRSSITAEKLFSRSAFEPSEEDLDPSLAKPKPKADANEDPNSVFWRTRKGKGKAKAKAKGKTKTKSKRVTVIDSADECYSEEEEASEDYEDDDNMSDFIVDSDEDEDYEEKSASRAIKKRLTKRTIVLDSDDEKPDEQVVFGLKPVIKPTPAAHDGTVMMMPKFLPSTKMKYMMEILRKLAQDRPDEKTIIVSQWTSCLGLVSNYLGEAGVAHVKYQGDMDRNSRDAAVRVFMTKDTARVMLMSLKCGGVGLNLTRANNVISLDLGWSQAVESQAFDRCHRLGQMRTVNIQRLVIADTVEDRVLTMQERKQTLADGSLGEGSGKKIGKLTVRELANLFGLDARGRRLQED
ncbi:SNF2/RAD54 helicase family protein [Pleurotus pulmonarius]